MLTVTESAAFVGASRELAQAAAARQVAVQIPEPGIRTRLLAQLSAHMPGCVVVSVPSALDQVERVVLDLASPLGPEVLRDVDAALRAEPDEISGPLARVESALGSRRIVVDGWDSLTHGGFGSAQDLGQALSARRATLQHWLVDHGGVLVVNRRRPGSITQWTQRPDGLDAPPQLRNGTKQLPPTDISDPTLALAAYALGARELVEQQPSPEELRQAIGDLLGTDARQVLAAVAVHGRPLPRDVAQFLGGRERAVDAVLRLGLCHEVAAGLIADASWAGWLQLALSSLELADLHRRLAQRFAESTTPKSMGLAVLEAHRHFVAAGMLDEARRFARYGAAQLVEAARERSRLRKYAEAAEIYNSVLSGAEQMHWPIGRKLRGYVRHYLHFNRATAGVEDVRATTEGYTAALEDWPDNALFWSRLVRAHFYQGNDARAMAALAQANLKVGDHPQKQTFLVARTVRGLLKRAHSIENQHLIFDALRVWGDYQPDTDYAEEVFSELSRRLAAGWTVEQLSGSQPIRFTRPMRVQIQCLGAGVWLAELPDVEVRGRGASPARALEAMSQALRAGVSDALRVLTHQLDAQARLRKRVLLGAIDVIASQLDAKSSDSVWVLGDVSRRPDGSTWLHTGGQFDLWFEVPEEIAAGWEPTDAPHFARVIAGASGEPHGPVQELEPAVHLSAEELWERFRRRLAGETD